jgi:hypothetical protein
MPFSATYISRRSFLKSSTKAGLSLIAWPRFDPAINQILLAAGNTEDELVRYRHLQSLLKHPKASTDLVADLQKILPIAASWAEGRKQAMQSDAEEKTYLSDFFNRPIRKGMFPEKISDEAPLYPLWCLYRGRLLVWITIQHGSLLHVEERREANYGEARKLLQVAQQAFPENSVIGMYLDQPIPWKADFSTDFKAPEWARLQRECLEKLTDIVEWWIDERQLTDGQYGGGWGDDVEMWRWWTPLLVGFEDTKLITAQSRLSNGLFGLARMQHGYTSRVDDVEHTAEDSGDTITAMMHIDPDDTIWKERALQLARLMRDRWSSINERGQLQFKSTYFSATEVDPTARRACDTVYHPRAVQPALLYWQRSGDAELTQLFSSWMDTWVDASMRTERGKPAGIIPSAIHWPDGSVGGTGKNWWNPENYTDNPLYVWPSSMSMMCNTMLLTYYMTADEKYISPILAMADMYMARKDHLSSNPSAGSVDWCVRQMDKFLPEVMAKLVQFRNEAQYQQLLLESGNGYVKYRLQKNEAFLNRELRKNAEAFRWNWPAFTSEVRWTDRILNFSNNYLKYTAQKNIPRFDADELYSMLSGDMGGALYFPMNVVRWLTSPRQFAALVEDWDTRSLTASIYHFGSEPRAMGIKLFLLEPGQYLFRLSSDEKVLEEKTFSRVDAATDVFFEAPTRQLCRLSVVKK